MKKSIKNAINGVLLIGGLAVGFVGAGMIAEATEIGRTLDMKKTDNNGENTKEFKFKEELTKLVREQGNQVILDEENNKMYLAYLNESNELEIVEITEKEYNDLMNQVQRISENGNTESKGEGSYIPREYLRGGQAPTEKKTRKKLNSEEGKQAIESAKQYKKANK